ncbi:MerR family transcriptional regulator [Paenibacillus sp. ACRRX]|uniref:MerR family transcriptional regulator n=1 Tax=unclassified Paenibacillus TaxID=185978 RepID=UPI001EF66B54|nr:MULTISPECIES: MerR family transcriptional regulator [unclassified Paenibacillus]MCG7408299.1 MerR family transcriptional regulator [Paenibacillus sp. ACRRX]MDK8181316.1 MerR family transcriptional regulator [Paenibacillus sp. UMB4589-SE434]
MHNTNTQSQDISDCIAQASTYSIGEVAKKIGAPIKTVRFYDEIGLVKPTSYTEGGHRLYTTEDIKRLELTTTFRCLDFEIDAISQIISGDRPVDKVIDWQLESLETQVRTLANIISILRQGRTQQGDPLRCIYDLVHMNAIHIEERKQFISERVKASKFLDGIPEEWSDSLFYFFNKYIINQVKLSAKQTVAWEELQRLINDPQFIEDLRSIEFMCFHAAHRPHFNAATWIRKLEDMQSRLKQALKNKYPAHSRFVQALVEEATMVYANSEQPSNKEEDFLCLAEYVQKTKSKHLERCNTLCSILSPQYHLLSKANLLLFQGIEWKFQHI